MPRIQLKRKIPWLFKYGLGLHKPRYRIGVPDLGLNKEENRKFIYGAIIFILALFFGGIFIVTYEFTPALIEIRGTASTIYPGFSRETLAEFFIASASFIFAALGSYFMRIAPRREVEEWSSYMSLGLLFFIIAMIVLAGVFSYKAGLLRWGR